MKKALLSVSALLVFALMLGQGCPSGGGGGGNENQADSLNVDVGPDRTIGVGESLEINATKTTYPDHALYTSEYIWTTDNASFKLSVKDNSPLTRIVTAPLMPATATVTLTVKLWTKGQSLSDTPHLVASDSLVMTAVDQSGSNPVATPTFTPGGGSFTTSQNVIISCATSGATIRYTTDGSTPSRTNGTTISGGSAVTLTTTTTLKAMAYKDGMTDSAVAQATYTRDSVIDIDNGIDMTIVKDLGSPLVAVAADGDSGELLFIMGDKYTDGSPKTVTGGIFRGANGKETMFWVGDNGFPSSIVEGDLTIFFTNYRNNLVDLTFVRANGDIQREHDVPFDPTLLTGLTRAGQSAYLAPSSSDTKQSRAAKDGDPLYMEVFKWGKRIASAACCIVGTASYVAAPLVVNTCCASIITDVLTETVIKPMTEVQFIDQHPGYVPSVTALSLVAAEEQREQAQNHVITSPVCGNGICEAGETCANCSADCGTCPGGETLTIMLPGGVPMELVKIPAGTFQMGDISGVGYSDERPVHTVTISRAFYMGKYELTQAQWQAVMGSNPSYFSGSNRPVEKVSWNDCQSFCQAVLTQAGYAVRLPTEAEWEYACRAGTTTDYYFGSDSSQLGQYAWYHANSGSQTHDVGGKLPNAFGLYDMHGNVWEWCQDWHGSYASTSQTDPSGPSTGAYRVLRGGSWLNLAADCRSAARNWVWPDSRGYYFGFRCALGTP